MADNCSVKVAIRVRPLAKYEIAKGCKEILDVVQENEQIVISGSDKAFTYNYVFNTTSSQEEVYDRCVKDTMHNLFKGYNVTILAYGQTGSGKTHSMGTNYKMDGEMGVIPRAVSDIFSYVHDHFSLDFTISVSFVELYQEVLYDLLSKKPRDQCVLEIREDTVKGVHIPNITEETVTSSDDVFDALGRGSLGRATGSTNMNSQSSRSHAIFTINICMQNKADAKENKMAKLHLVDLAGSERPKKTGAIGNTFKEGVNINKGLFVLGNVISCLGDEKQQNSFVPYRDSNLTRLLKDSLGGNSITLMIACVSPADYNLEETMSTLRYADRARKIKNKPIVNQDAKVAEINELKKTIQQLRLQIVGQGGPVICPAEIELLKKQIDDLQKKIREQSVQLSAALVDKTGLLEKVLILQTANEKLSQKLSELGEEFDITVANISTGLEKNDTDVIKENMLKLQNLQNKFLDINTEQKETEKEIKHHEDTFVKNFFNVSGDGPEDSPEMHEEQDAHTHKQVELNTELQEITKQLAMKECLAKQLIANAQIMVDYSALTQNEEKISALQKEKDELVQQLKSAQSRENSGKIAEQRRKRVKELEGQIHDLNKKVQEQARLIKMKEKDEQRIKQLNQEITQMKQAKVKLIRTMREESDKFKLWKMQRERELTKLKQQDRKKETEIAKMKLLNAKQQNVLKRKVEEANALNKRLQHSLMLKKQAQNMKNTGKIERVGEWIKQELDLGVNIVAAKETLAILLEDRATLQQQLNILKADPETEGSEECKSIKEDLECRSAQIQDLQQKILDSDEDNKAKTRFDNIQTMAEAKFALKSLYDLSIEIKKKEVQTNAKLVEVQETLKEVEKSKKAYNNMVKILEEKCNTFESNLQNAYEEKVSVLLRQLRGVKGDEDEEADQALLQRCEIQQDKIESQEKVIDELRQKLEEMKNQYATVNEKIHKINDVTQNFGTPVATLQKPLTKKNPSKVSAGNETFVKFDDNNDEKENFILDSSVEEEVDDNINDPDWRKTPLGRRVIDEVKKVKMFKQSYESDRITFKRSSEGGCTCRTNCQRRCGCRKLFKQCGEYCRCNSDTCQNQDANNKDSTSNNSSNPSDENDSFKKPRLEDTTSNQKHRIRSRLFKNPEDLST